MSGMRGKKGKTQLIGASSHARRLHCTSAVRVLAICMLRVEEAGCNFFASFVLVQ
jgi:hypothetical protein